MKKCSDCNKNKKLSEFYKPKSSKHGCKKRCVSCQKQYTKKYYQENKERIKEYKKKYRKENKDKIKKEKREYYQNNKEKIKIRKRKYHKNNPRVTKNSDIKRRALKKGCLGSITPKELKEISSILDCEYCGIKLTSTKDYSGTSLNIDHYIPLSRKGTNNKENLKASCRKCNLSKGSKLPHIWLKEEGYLEDYDKKSTEKYKNSLFNE